MARIKDGALLGKVANLVGYRYRDSYYIRKAPVRKAPPTQKELESQFIFRLIIDWLQPLTPLLRIGFKNPRVSGFNAAHSQLHKEAVHKEGFQSYIDPSLAKISSGSLTATTDVQVELNPQKQLVFTWDPTLTGNKSPRDRVLLLAYNVERKTPITELSGAKRTVGSDALDLSFAPSGIYHLYAGFVAEDGNSQSDSVYLGEVEI